MEAQDSNVNINDDDTTEEDLPPDQKSRLTTKSTNKSTSKSSKIAPIAIKKTPNYKDIISKIEGEIINKTTKKVLRGDTIKNFLESITDHRAIQKFLEDNALEFFAMIPRNERPKEVLLRGIPP